MHSVSEAWAHAQYKRAMRLLENLGESHEDNHELALDALTKAMSYYTYEQSPERWARIMLELGSLYGFRRKGGKSENVECSIRCYTEALRVFGRESHPCEWAECQRGLGKAFFSLADGVNTSLKERSIVHYEMALGVITKESWPELWHVIHLELSILYRRYALNMANEDLRLAWAHYRIAFDLDKHKYSALDKSMRCLHVLYSELRDIQKEIASVEGA